MSHHESNPRVCLWALVMAPLTLVGSVLWALVLHMVHNGYVLVPRLRGYTKGPCENPWRKGQHRYIKDGHRVLHRDQIMAALNDLVLLGCWFESEQRLPSDNATCCAGRPRLQWWWRLQELERLAAQPSSRGPGEAMKATNYS